MTDDEKKELTEYVISQLKNNGVDISTQTVIQTVDKVSSILAYSDSDKAIKKVALNAILNNKDSVVFLTQHKGWLDADTSEFSTAKIENGILDLGTDPILFINGEAIGLDWTLKNDSDKYRKINLIGVKDGIQDDGYYVLKVLYNTKTPAIKVVGYTTPLEDGDVVLGVCSTDDNGKVLSHSFCFLVETDVEREKETAVNEQLNTITNSVNTLQNGVNGITETVAKNTEEIADAEFVLDELCKAEKPNVVLGKMINDDGSIVDADNHYAVTELIESGFSIEVSGNVEIYANKFTKDGTLLEVNKWHGTVLKTPKDANFRYQLCLSKSVMSNGFDNVEKVLDSITDFKVFNSIGAKRVTWNVNSNMNDFTVAGVYDIYGERTMSDDNLPIDNTGGGHTFNARLTVLDSSISGTGESDDKCITQVLSFSNRLGQGEVYIRTAKGSSLSKNHRGRVRE